MEYIFVPLGKPPVPATRFEHLHGQSLSINLKKNPCTKSHTHSTFKDHSLFDLTSCSNLFISIHTHARATPAIANNIHKITFDSTYNLRAHRFVVALKPICSCRYAQIAVPKTRQPRPPCRVSHSPCSLLRFIRSLTLNQQTR